ncbi:MULTISPECIES: pitrilysin family protein [unclassified Pseudomonas]|uniref:M16 family metallopeptidase n=1 Tax=unclassified Pseudomonas TaxID=196821 RepID=UPI000757D144|nr:MULTISPECIES: pitrilysin family protein [unclassified Pseudomonas]KVV01313.1 Protease 3 precursor [Pseudomonas sp. TAD18]KVV02671.1 Protease 3 precursor [Pseudomonas sp. TAA207]
MKRSILGRWLITLWLPATAFAIPAPSTQEFILDNGLKLIVHEDHRSAVVHTHLWYRVGSNNEPPGQSGISHAVEHMVFNGSSKLCSGEGDHILQTLGGSDNATTRNDTTLYFQTLAPHALGVSFEILADRMSTAHLSAAQWLGEREVIKNERSESVDNSHVQRGLEMTLRIASPSSAAGNPTIGWKHDLDRLNVEELQHWYRRWYAPNNAILVVTGGIETEHVKALAERYFGGIARREVPVNKIALEVAAPGERKITQYFAHQPAMLHMLFNVPSMSTQTDPRTAPSLELLRELLAGGRSALLNAQLVHNEALLIAVTAEYNAISRSDELFSITSFPDLEKANSTDAATQRIWAVIDSLKNAPPALEDLERARTQLIAQQVFKRDELHDHALHLGELEIADLSWRTEQARLDVMKSITPEDIQRTAQRFLVRDRLTTSAVLPLERAHE